MINATVHYRLHEGVHGQVRGKEFSMHIIVYLGIKPCSINVQVCLKIFEGIVNAIRSLAVSCNFSSINQEIL